MNNTENQNEQMPKIEAVEPSTGVMPSRVSETPQNPMKPVKKKRSTLAITAAFMAGALMYAIAAGAYNFYFQTQDNELLKLKAQNESQVVTKTQTQPLTEQTKISEEEVAKSVETTDCLAKPEYSELVLKGIKMKIASIDLYDGLQVTSATTGGAVRWTSTPKVTNYKCEVIKISDLKVGDRVNVFVSKTSSGMLDTRMLQKATK